MSLSFWLVPFVLAGNPQVPSVKSAHPHGYKVLATFAPECAKPKPEVNLGSCMTAASMLEQKPLAATQVFIAAWERTAFGRPGRKFDAAVWVTDANLDPDTGKVVPPEDGLTPDPVVDAKVKAFQRICAKALLKVYARTNDTYAKAMLPAAKAVTIADLKSLAEFSSKHLEASGEPTPAPTPKGAVLTDDTGAAPSATPGKPVLAAATPGSTPDFWSKSSPTPAASGTPLAVKATPAPSPTAVAKAAPKAAGPSPAASASPAATVAVATPTAAPRILVDKSGVPAPKGHGPLPLQIDGRWTVIEAGQELSLKLSDGTTRKGKLEACNSQALLLDEDGQPEVVATSDLKEISKD